MARLRIGISGGGVGGLASAIALRKAGHDVEVLEQAPSFRRVGADINLTPNVVRALDGFGAVPALMETAAKPTHRISRMWDTGQETSRLEMAQAAEQRYGAPQLTILSCRPAERVANTTAARRHPARMSRERRRDS